MYVAGKRTRKKQPQRTTRVTKPFRAPRRAVIPGLLRQTAIEKKVLFIGDADSTNTFLPLNATATILGLNLIQVGSSMFNRIGRKIEMRSIRLVCEMLQIPGLTRATTTVELGRVMVVYDRQTNGAFPAIADILQDTEQTGANTTNSFSGINMNNRERFVTIIDKKITVPQGTATAGVLTNVFPNDVMLPCKWDEFRKLKGLTTHFKADSSPAVIGDIATGGLYIVSLTNLTAAGAELFQLAWNVRLKYVDA
ncbi:capsid [uncultured virus]|uniref:Capsid n=1 Tax=uncultured virus TaxID=340016 RepID=A0A2K9LW70_9VIRU|nr:capsid [uncultured virus]